MVSRGKHAHAANELTLLTQPTCLGTGTYVCASFVLALLNERSFSYTFREID